MQVDLHLTCRYLTFQKSDLHPQKNREKEVQINLHLYLQIDELPTGLINIYDYIHTSNEGGLQEASLKG